ncbi:unnamed protein product [Trifolium pratense]|uniref:Uncharacterized protein n=1 Tax=Trifolium pratense TaxID=57577 RepID=A0ACB0KEV7_TRIPR|nr:unnamed protein product [Trifolium pratense]
MNAYNLFWKLNLSHRFFMNFRRDKLSLTDSDVVKRELESISKRLLRSNATKFEFQVEDLWILLSIHSTKLFSIGNLFQMGNRCILIFIYEMGLCIDQK